MIIDTHIHAYPYSDDSKITLPEIVAQARKIGLDGICITDHDTNAIWQFAHQYRKVTNFPIFVGAEILTYEGDMLVFGLEHLPKKKLHAQELLELAHRQQGIGVSAHPFRTNNRGMGDIIRDMPHLDGIEAFNGSTDPLNNKRALKLAQEKKIPILGASDAHTLGALGVFATHFPDGMQDEADIIAAVRSGAVYPVIYQNRMFVPIGETE
jgi:predicted metal-dependent phosphoesterase TrpH